MHYLRAKYKMEVS